ncbi:hypothetical protein HW555_003021 [Spodoptera exigua]|uniref:Nuclease HARBI1 n=1 Tax=Spodoptera exigua TaxID=7107 RepID=A0A835GPN7_SPOEX|nr:hypothetical protein HW555_003021 [Spodoptera exigua]
MRPKLDELEHSSTQRIARIRVFKFRVDYFTDLDETDFFARFRLSKYAVNQVHNFIKHKIMPKSQRNQAVPTKTSLLLTLRYLATGSYLRSAADFCGVSPPTASRIVKKVTEAIAQLRTVIIKFPDNLSTLQDGFYEIASFPRVIGALDCTHVAIKSPEENSCFILRNSTWPCPVSDWPLQILTSVRTVSALVVGGNGSNSFVTSSTTSVKKRQVF